MLGFYNCARFFVYHWFCARWHSQKIMACPIQTTNAQNRQPYQTLKSVAKQRRINTMAGNELQERMIKVIFQNEPGNPGPLISEVWGAPPPEAKTIPADQLPMSERNKIEQMPAIPNRLVCVPLESGALGDVCKPSSTLTQKERLHYQQDVRVHLSAEDRVAPIQNGYIIIPPVTHGLMD
jgi:hypothetical protein